MIELLSPAGNFECVKSSIQNGANAIYFGASSFSARAYAGNFDYEELKNTIIYCKTRNVKTFLALNTLLKDDEFETALDIIKNTYAFGIDAIIVQDLGLAKIIKKDFPDLPLHASTQLSVHNLNGVLELEKLGFKRVVLSRELSISEIKYICDNSNVEIECFIHGALCISYSGQCLFSSMIGGRSGNRGKCAQPCRLPYSLFNKTTDNKSDNGYLMSPRDLCGIDLIPNLINAGVHCLKIEGRMKSPEYDAIVTKIYRKYIDLAYSNTQYSVSPTDKKNLLQAFNRGNFSTGHLNSKENTNLIFKEKPNNMGIYLGKVIKYVEHKGYITLKLHEEIQIGDTISIQNESGTYTISEIMDRNVNLKTTTIDQIVTIGRIKGNIKVGDNIYKISSKSLLQNAKNSYSKENIKIPLSCSITIKENSPIYIEITTNNNIPLYENLYIKYTTDTIPVQAIKKPINKEDIIKQILKTNDTPFIFNNINIDLDNNLFIPKLSILNDLRRKSIDLIYEYIEKMSVRTLTNSSDISKSTDVLLKKSNDNNTTTKKISLLLNNINTDFDYSDLEYVDRIYIPIWYFNNTDYTDILNSLNAHFNIYIYLPTIMKDNFNTLFKNTIENALKTYQIKGIVLSQIGNIVLIKDIIKDLKDSKLELISNYTFNITNSYSFSELINLGFNTITISPELDLENINNICNFNTSSNNFTSYSELIVYGKIPVMNMNYCFLGKSNKCYINCNKNCDKNINSHINSNYYLKDKLNMNFDINIDTIQTISTVYNSKILSIIPSSVNSDFIRIDILNEDIATINSIINNVKNNKRLEGNDYTNGNMYRTI